MLLYVALIKPTFRRVMRIDERSVLRLLVTADFNSPILVTLMMEAMRADVSYKSHTA
jgi:hypothetical protein